MPQNQLKGTQQPVPPHLTRATKTPGQTPKGTGGTGGTGPEGYARNPLKAVEPVVFDEAPPPLTSGLAKALLKLILNNRKSAEPTIDYPEAA